MKVSDRKILCYVCRRVVETHKVEIDYHKGAQYYGFKTVYPHEEKRIEFPEGRESGIHVCQDCLDGPSAMKNLIKLARVNAVNYRIERGKKRDKQDKTRMATIRKRRKENKERVSMLQDYLLDLESAGEPRYDWETLKIDDPF